MSQKALHKGTKYKDIFGKSSAYKKQLTWTSTHISNILIDKPLTTMSFYYLEPVVPHL